MIDLRQLMIGNIVNDISDKGWGIVKVESILSGSLRIYCHSLNSEYLVDYQQEHLEGIPLTHEWLERFGWVWNEDCKSFEKYPNGDARMHLQFRDVSVSYTMFNHVLKAVIAERIFFVHQLQNLYFSLTGKELELKQ